MNFLLFIQQTPAYTIQTGAAFMGRAWAVDSSQSLPNVFNGHLARVQGDSDDTSYRTTDSAGARAGCSG